MINIQFKLKDLNLMAKLPFGVFSITRMKDFYIPWERTNDISELWDSKAMRPIDTRSKEAKKPL
ncbi:MAG: hypothetical protein IPN97_07700 [Saprospiraceae bacterium]|nr:hypothetical protein [Saprospiraceae bacterium]